MAYLAAVLAFDISSTATDDARLGAITNVVALGVAVRASDLGLLDHLGLLRAVLANVAFVAAVAADGDHTVHGETGILETFEVLLRGLGPALGHDSTTRLGGLLDRDNVLLAGDTLEINVGVNHRRDHLFLGDEVVLEVGLTEALLQLNQSELGGQLAVEPESFQEVVDVALGISVEKVLPSLVGILDLGKVNRVDVVLVGAVGRIVTGVLALLAHGLGAGRSAVTLETADTAFDLGAVGAAVALLATVAAGTGEGALDGLVGAVSLVVADLTAVEAFSGHLTRFRAVLGPVTVLAAAVGVMSVREVMMG